MPTRDRIARAVAAAAAAALLSCAASAPARADSPLTSTDFARFYANVKMVAHARRARQIDGRLQRWLLAPRGRLDQRLAAINGLGTPHRGDVQALARAIAARHNASWTQLAVNQLSGREALLLGYALARCDTRLGPLRAGGGAGGLAAATPLQLVAHARARLRRSFSAHLIAALVEGQKKMSTSFCDVYMGAHRVLRRFGKRRDMRRRAAAKILGYMRLYRDDCPQFRPKRDPRLDQIYDIVRYGRFIVTGTQGGVVVWDVKRRRRHATHKTFIAARLLVVGNALWIGAHHEVLRYDGTRFRSYLKAPRARGHELYLDDQGRLCARRGRRAWAYDGRRFRPTRVRARGFHTLVRTIKGGGGKQLWTIDFLRKLQRLAPNPRDYPIKSPLYPGRDPRRFYQDPRGRLWVVDFDDGFFRYDDSADRFRLVQRIGHGSDMAVDAKHGRSWFVDYRRGLLLDDRKGGRNIALAKLQYIRRIYLDPDGSGTLWVGGWTQLLRLELKNGALQRQAFSVAGPRRAGKPARGARSTTR